jgi:DNA-binding transcriptional ArsR family regulator
MENFRTPDHNLSATYMTQAEANEVMELLAIRQREEAARQSLITVHDVAEATQLSSLEVERLLQEVRSTGGVRRDQTAHGLSTGVQSPPAQKGPTLREAWRKLALWTILLAVPMALYLDEDAPAIGSHSRALEKGLLYYAIGMGLWQLFRLVEPHINEAFRRSINASSTRT